VYLLSNRTIEILLLERKTGKKEIRLTNRLEDLGVFTFEKEQIVEELERRFAQMEFTGIPYVDFKDNINADEGGE